MAGPVPSRAGPIIEASLRTPPMPGGTVTAVSLRANGFSLNMSDCVIETSLERRTVPQDFPKVCHGYPHKVRSAASSC